MTQYGGVLVDQHCHSVRIDELDGASFDALCTESPYAPVSGRNTDSPLGLAIRRWCPPVLGLQPFADIDDYLAARSQLGSSEVARRLIAATATDTFLVDTGYRGDELAPLAGFAALAGGRSHEIVRIETLAEQVAAADPNPGGFFDRLADALTRSDAVAFKSVLVYRAGFDIALVDGPDPTAALHAWLSAGPGSRLSDPALLAAGLRVAVDVAAARQLPIQFHVGLGDPDLTLHRTNPSLLTAFVEHCLGRGVNLVLLHCWPYEREAAYLASVYPNVYVDVGLSLNYVGPEAPRFLARALELAPYAKLLYSSDAFGLPELYCSGAAQFRWALGTVLDGWVAAGSCPRGDAEGIAAAISAGNARRLYRLG